MTTFAGRPRWSALLLAAAVALAFADSSIVVLAVPQLLGTFSSSVTALSWIITAYNVAVAVGALALPLLLLRRHARRHVLAAESVFVLASIACAAAPNLPVLIVARVSQGVGAAVLLAVTLPLLVELLGSPRRGLAIWSAAAAVGAAMGPALGGVLTEAFSWRAIFVAQIPVAAAALVVLSRHGGPQPGGPDARQPAGALPPTPAEVTAGRVDVGRTGWRPQAALALLSGALVGSLFLVIILFIDVWGLSPLAAAGIAVVLPAATALVVPAGRRLNGRSATLAGCLLVAVSLVELAGLPGRNVGLAVAELAVGGAGLGLALPVLTELSAGVDYTTVRAAGRSAAVRHAGLVLTLVVAAPLLSANLMTAKRAAVTDGAEILFAAPAPVTTRLALGLDLADTVKDAPSGRLPALQPVFDRHGARTNAVIESVYREVEARTVATLTGSFRPTLLFCAGLALLAVVAAAGIRAEPVTARPGGRPGPAAVRGRRWPVVGAAAGVTISGGLLLGELLARPDLPSVPRPAACAAIPAGGPVNSAERLVVTAVQATACRAHADPSHLLLALTGVYADAAGQPPAQLAQLLRTQLLSEVAAAVRAHQLTPLTASVVDFYIRNQSLSSLLHAVSGAGNQ